MNRTLKTYLDLARAELRMAARMQACGYADRAQGYVANAKHWIASYWDAKPR